jgi:PAS domain S-box-containing protein
MGSCQSSLPISPLDNVPLPTLKESPPILKSLSIRESPAIQKSEIGDSSSPQISPVSSQIIDSTNGLQIRVSPAPLCGTEKIIRRVRQESLDQSQRHLKLFDEFADNPIEVPSQLDTLIKHFPDGIVIIDHTGEIRNYNPAVVDLFKIQTLERKHITTLIPLSNHSFEPIRVGQSMDIIKSDNYTETFEYKHKSLYLEVSYGRIKTNRKIRYYGFIIIFKDVTKKHLYDEILSNLLPPQIMTKIRSGEKIKDIQHPSVTIGFCDIVKFTQLTIENPNTISKIITELFDKFDEYTRLLGVTKIQRIGDSYMVACGLFGEPDHATKVIELMKAGILYANRHLTIKLRVGIHTGPVTSCLIGKELPQFSLFGPDVIIASRLESTCPPNAIHITEATRSLLQPDQYPLDINGSPTLKGFGSLHSTSLIPVGTK